jgi:hypothetical protein
MNKMQARSSEPLRDVLYQFSLAKEIPDAELLDEYVRLYPDYAEQLTDFAVQLVVESKQAKVAEARSPETRVTPVVSRAMSRFQSALHSAKTRPVLSQVSGADATPAVNPFANLGRDGFRRVAKELQANTHFLCLVRDGMVVFLTMPPGFLRALAAAVRGPLDDVTDYLRTRTPVVAAGQMCKADDKPEAGTQITFEEAVKRSGLTPEQQKFLLSL